MKYLVKACLALIVLFSVAGCSGECIDGWLEPGTIILEEVATSPRQWTGIAISQDGRIFVNYPLWSASQPFAVGEMQPDGTVKPFPNEALNSWQPGRSPQTHFVCVQALYVDKRNRLWILDPANPRFEGVVPGGPKLVSIDLVTNEIIHTYHFGPEVALPDSYLNDLRVDGDRNVVYMTDSGNGALIVLDLKSGNARRLLDGHPSTQSEDIVLIIEDKPWLLPNGDEPRIHADGIALSSDGNWLYYQALTGRTLYRIETKNLRDTALADKNLGSRVETVGASGASDGIVFGLDGCVYLTSLEANAIRRTCDCGPVEAVVEDDRISWPDSFALGPEGALYFTTAQIHKGGNPEGPYRIFRLRGKE